MGWGDRSVTFIEEYQTTNQSRSRKVFAKSQIQPQAKGKTEMWSNCRMWTALSQKQILLEVGLSRTSLKTMKQ